MLRPYTYFEHELEKWKRYVDFIVDHVWNKAATGIAFDTDLFDNKQEIKGFISHCGFAQNATKPQRKFYEDVKGIYESCSALSSAEIQEIQNWYRSYSSVANICEDPVHQCVSTKFLSSSIRLTVAKIITFLKSLWNADLLGKRNLRMHYQEFLEKNQPAKCHFCGVSDMVSLAGYREDYDHFLPKSKYPVNSVDFRNLVPTCHHCNSKFKGAKDPVYDQDKNRRKAFYPYDQNNLRPEVQISIESIQGGTVLKDQCHITLTPEDSQEVNAWNELYRIEDRYIEICTGADGKAWLEFSRIQKERRKLSLADQIGDLKEEMNLCDPLATCNFLKLAFLEACHNLELVDNLEKPS